MVDYTPISDEKARALAMDIADSKVFCSLMLKKHEQQHMQMIFLPLALGAVPPTTSEELNADPRFPKGDQTEVMFYEYYDKAGPTGINGFPIFFSFCFLLGEDVNKVWALALGFQKAKEDMIRGVSAAAG
jgi:hypothetical protein